MANELDINSFVYSFLLKKAPKCAELFSKSNKVKKLPPGVPALEQIIQNAFSKAVSPKVQGKVKMSLPWIVPTSNLSEMPPKKNKSEEDRKREKKEAERKRREKIKENPALRAEAARKEHERYLQRKAKGQIKSIKEMTKREQRSKRKQWRENTRKKRQKTFQQNEMLEEKIVPTLSISTPSVGYLEVNLQSTTSSCASRGRKRVRRDRSSVVRRCKNLEQQLKFEKRKSEKYRKKYYRLSNQMQEKSNTPRSKVNKYLKTKPSLKSIRKKLIFSEVLKSEVHEGYSAARSIEEKRSFYRVIKGHILKKYRQLKYCKSFFKKTVNVKHLVQRRRKSVVSFPSLVRRFLENDENSRQCPGKKDCITRNMIKIQKRLLNGTMANLHQKFVAETKFKISYTTFTRLRPFWIIAPYVSKRDTCLCIIHENAELLVNAAHKFSIINETTPTALCKTVCCDIWSEDCLQRTCLNCKSRTIDFNEENLKDDSEIAYLKWISKNIEVENGKIKKKTVKEEFFNTKKEFIEILKKSLFQYMIHLRNIVHQYRAVKEIKEGLTNEDILIHMDFSENYNCKYGAEPQAVHFGSSRMSITLHTGIMYYLCNDTHELKTEPFCTVSSNLRHDASAVWAHLKPIFLKVNSKIPQLKTINFLSDSPSNQYRNKKIFYFISNQIKRDVPTVQKVLWNYSESGHGKGAPDGVGGVLKRTADRIVACAKDIPDLETFVHLLKECQGVEIYTVSDKDILDVDDLLPKNLVPFKGTMKTHQAVWCQEDPAKVYFRHLTCLQCKVGMCTHFSIGSWSGVPTKEKESSLQGQWVAVIYDNNWYPANSKGPESSSDSSSDSDSDTPKTSISAGGVTKSPANISLNKKESSSDSDSSTDSGNKKQSNQAQLGKVVGGKNVQLSQNTIGKAIAEKKNESSSDSSSSEDEKPPKTSKTPMKVAISSKQSHKVAKQSSSDSSSDSEDDVPKPAAKSNTPAKNKILIKGSSVTQIQKIPPHNAMAKKGNSSDSSSDSEDETQAQPKKNPNESGNWAPKISKFAAEFSDDSESESDKGVMVSLAKKVPLSKSPVTKQVSPAAGLPPSKLSSANKQDDSSDSSSESEDEPNKASQMKNAKIPVSVKTPVTAFKKTVHDMSDSEDSEDSSDSSDSDAGKDTNKSLNKKPQLTPKPTIACPSKKPAASIKSKKDSSDSSSEEETSVNLLNKKNLLNKSPSKTPIASNSALSKKDSSDDSSDSSSDEKSHVAKISFNSSMNMKNKQSKPNTPQINASASRKPSNSSDSSSDDETPNTAKTSLTSSLNKKNQQMKQNTAVKPSPKKPMISTLSKKDSSDSSSDSSDEKSKVVQNKSISGTKVVKSSAIGTTKSVNNKDDTSSSDSEEEPVKNMPVKMPVPHPSKGKQDSSSSDSSDDETKKAPQKQIQNKVISPKSNVNIKKANNKEDSSSSDSEDEKPQPKTAVTLTKNIQSKSPKLPQSNIAAAMDEDSDSSDSSTDDNLTQSQSKLQNTPAKSQGISMKPQNNSKKKASSSSSSSEDEDSNTAQKPTISKPSNIKLPMNANAKPSSKESSSSDSSDSDDDTSKQVSTKQNSLKRPLASTNLSNIPNKKKLATPSKNVNQTKKQSSSDSSSSEDETTLKQNIPVKAKSTVSPLQRKVQEDSSSSESESDEDIKQKTNSKVNKAQDINASKRKKSSSSESDEEAPDAGFQPPKKTKKEQAFPLNQNNDAANQYRDNRVTSDSTKRRRGSSPFRRVKSENIVIDHRLKKSADMAKQSFSSFQGVRGKQFRHEKTKKKRMGAIGGSIDTSVKSIRFDD